MQNILRRFLRTVGGSEPHHIPATRCMKVHSVPSWTLHRAMGCERKLTLAARLQHVLVHCTTMWHRRVRTTRRMQSVQQLRSNLLAVLVTRLLLFQTQLEFQILMDEMVGWLLGSVGWRVDHYTLQYTAHSMLRGSPYSYHPRTGDGWTFHHSSVLRDDDWDILSV